ncbi:MAG: hypothetical protein ACRCYO_11325, partial [Bacteroidia bacterium]
MKNRLNEEIPDSSRAEAFVSLGWQVSYENLSEGLVYAQKGLALAQEIQNNGIESRAWNVVGAIYLDLGDYIRATEAHLNAIRIREAQNDMRGLAT